MNNVITIQIVTPEDHWLNRIATWLYQRWMRARVRRLRVDPNAQCPACGHMDGEIRFIIAVPLPNNTNGALIHRCKICDANWVEKPIIEAKAWVVDVPPLDRNL